MEHLSLGQAQRLLSALRLVRGSVSVFNPISINLYEFDDFLEHAAEEVESYINFLKKGD